MRDDGRVGVGEGEEAKVEGFDLGEHMGGD